MPSLFKVLCHTISHPSVIHIEFVKECLQNFGPNTSVVKCQHNSHILNLTTGVSWTPTLSVGPAPGATPRRTAGARAESTAHPDRGRGRGHREVARPEVTAATGLRRRRATGAARRAAGTSGRRGRQSRTRRRTRPPPRRARNTDTGTE